MLSFVLTNLLLGVGLAMDAFSVSLANGLAEPKMSVPRMAGIAGIYAFFQALMPMTGWFCVHGALSYFTIFSRFIPYIALALLLYIGGKMLIDGIRNKEKSEEEKITVQFPFTALLLQGVATSIDALSVGFTIAEYGVWEALLAAGIIASATYLICAVGLYLGKRFGTRLAGKATVFGGLVLINIGIEIFVKGVFFA